VLSKAECKRLEKIQLETRNRALNRIGSLTLEDFEPNLILEQAEIAKTSYAELQRLKAFRREYYPLVVCVCEAQNH